MVTLALDVDGVLLDPDRNGAGPWANELTKRFGIERIQLQEVFFARAWSDVVVGRRSVEDGLAEALGLIGSTSDVEAVLSCWFESDFVPIAETFDLARRAAAAGCRVVLVTDQEHRRAAYLHRRFAAELHLDRAIYSAKVGRQKHDPGFFEIASDLLGLRPEERSSVVFVDDSVRNVEAARSSGWRAIHASGDQPWHHDVAALLEPPPPHT